MHSIKWQCFQWPWVTSNPLNHPIICIFRRLSWQRPLTSGNMQQIHHLYIKHFHMVKRLRKSVQYIRRYSTKNASFWLCRIWRSQISTVKSEITGPNFKKFSHNIGHRLHFYYAQLDHDIAIRFLAWVQWMQEVSVGVDNVFAKLFGCHGNDPWQIRK